jgi:hypothetical protein
MLIFEQPVWPLLGRPMLIFEQPVWPRLGRPMLIFERLSGRGSTVVWRHARSALSCAAAG